MCRFTRNQSRSAMSVFRENIFVAFWVRTNWGSDTQTDWHDLTALAYYIRGKRRSQTVVTLNDITLLTGIKVSFGSDK